MGVHYEHSEDVLVGSGLFCAGDSAFAQSSTTVNIDPFFAILDTNQDGSIGKGEWKDVGLMDASFPLCDPNKDDKITRQEMAACAVPESMDPKKEGLSLCIPEDVLSFHRLALHSQTCQRPAGNHAGNADGRGQPLCGSGPAGQDFIKLFDADGDGKVSHMEWEKLKNQTVFKPYRWPQYNRNRDEWITVEEAPRTPANK